MFQEITTLLLFIGTSVTFTITNQTMKVLSFAPIIGAE